MKLYLLLFNYHISHISFSVFFLPVAIFFPLFIFQLFLIFLFVSVLSLTQNLSYQGDTVMGHYWPVTSWEAG